MSYDPVVNQTLMRLLESKLKKPEQTKVAPQYLPSLRVDQTQFINPAYTQAPSMDAGLSPLEQFQAFKQTAVMPQEQSAFTPWAQPSTPMVEAFTHAAQAKPGVQGSLGGK